MDSPSRTSHPLTVWARPPRFAICTLGCKLNQSDEAEVRSGLRQAGLREVDFASQADVYIVNTCTVTHLADRRSRQMLRRARRQNPASVVAAIGCYPSVSPEELEAMPEVDLISGSIDKLTIVDDVLDRLGWSNQLLDGDEPTDGFATRTRGMIKIQEGCRAHCTYCVIPRARGAPRNIAPVDVIARVNDAVEAGYREVVLTGTHVGTYKWHEDDSILRLADLIERVLAETSIERLRITSVGPHEIDERFISIVNNPRVAAHLHLALQSGSPTVLKRMKRWYNLQQYRRAVRRLYQEIPEIGITTDVIVGFPGETDTEFAETCEFVQEMRFAKIHVFPFSARRNTAAAGYQDPVPPPLKARRSAQLRAIGDQLHASFLSRQVGQPVEVLLEHEVASDNDGDQVIWSGLTGNYTRIFVPLQPGVDYGNRFVQARTIEPLNDGLLAEPSSATW